MPRERRMPEERRSWTTDWKYPAAVAALLAMIGVVTLLGVLAYLVFHVNDELQTSIDNRQCEHAVQIDRQDVIVDLIDANFELIESLHGGQQASIDIQTQMENARRKLALLRQQLATLDVTC